MYNVAIRGSPFLCTTSQLPSQPKLVPIIHVDQEKQVRMKCLAHWHNVQPTQGSNSRPWDHESGALPLSYVTEPKVAKKKKMHSKGKKIIKKKTLLPYIFLCILKLPKG